jgi:hypothetical protein
MCPAPAPAPAPAPRLQPAAPGRSGWVGVAGCTRRCGSSEAVLAAGGRRTAESQRPLTPQVPKIRSGWPVDILFIKACTPRCR